jgi:hypothetical protein
MLGANDLSSIVTEKRPKFELCGIQDNAFTLPTLFYGFTPYMCRFVVAACRTGQKPTIAAARSATIRNAQRGRWGVRWHPLLPLRRNRPGRCRGSGNNQPAPNKLFASCAQYNRMCEHGIYVCMHQLSIVYTIATTAGERSDSTQASNGQFSHQ